MGAEKNRSSPSVCPSVTRTGIRMKLAGFSFLVPSGFSSTNMKLSLGTPHCASESSTPTSRRIVCPLVSTIYLRRMSGVPVGSAMNCSVAYWYGSIRWHTTVTHVKATSAENVPGSRASSTVIFLCPILLNLSAHASPAGPPPTMTISSRVDSRSGFEFPARVAVSLLRLCVKNCLCCHGFGRSSPKHTDRLIAGTFHMRQCTCPDFLTCSINSPIEHYKS